MLRLLVDIYVVSFLTFWVVGMIGVLWDLGFFSRGEGDE